MPPRARETRQFCPGEKMETTTLLPQSMIQSSKLPEPHSKLGLLPQRDHLTFVPSIFRTRIKFQVKRLAHLRKNQPHLGVCQVLYRTSTRSGAKRLQHVALVVCALRIAHAALHCGIMGLLKLGIEHSPMYESRSLATRFLAQRLRRLSSRSIRRSPNADAESRCR
jgi:hypothetical protein